MAVVQSEPQSPHEVERILWQSFGRSSLIEIRDIEREIAIAENRRKAARKSRNFTYAKLMRVRVEALRECLEERKMMESLTDAPKPALKRS